MIYCEDNSIGSIAIFGLVNDGNGRTLRLPDSLAEPDDRTIPYLINYFIAPFKSEEYYRFHHNSDLYLNEVYAYVSKIFADPGDIFGQATNIAKHLYDKSDHPKIKCGELYVVYFNECSLDGDTVDAVGIFKSENRDTYLEVSHSANNYQIESREGININKLDKGCLIFNKEREDGYVVAVVDNTNKGSETRYWFDDFLNIRQRKDRYYNTENVMTMCRNYVVKQLPGEFEVSKAEQAELLNRSAGYFKENDTFNMQSFTEEVMSHTEVIESFNSFRQSYQEDLGVEISDEFEISSSAVKKQARAFKSVIKLDRNFHIYVHGNNQYLKRGYDEVSGMHYYQLFFKEEL